MSQIRCHWPSPYTGCSQNLQCTNPPTPPPPLRIIDAPISASTSDADTIPDDNKEVILAVSTVTVPVTIYFPIASFLTLRITVIANAKITVRSDYIKYIHPPTNGYIRW